MAANTALFTPLQLGSNTLKTRIIMSPMSRFRADTQHIQLPYAASYYSQRATDSALIIAENTAVSPRASGFSNTPGIWSPEQIASWKNIVDAVHAKGGLFFLQLCALGRPAEADVLREGFGLDVVSASDVPMASEGAAVPRPLTGEEIALFVKDFAQGAKNAVELAGFDGVEVHGAYGYLLDQFTQDVSNRRTDGYGGSVENRSRFPLEVVKAVVDAVGADKVGYRMSPWSSFQSMGMEESSLKAQFTHLVKGLADLELAYLHVILDRGKGDKVSGGVDEEAKAMLEFVFDAWGSARPVLLAGGFTVDTAVAAVDRYYKGGKVATVFARPFTSNPDLVYRIKHGIPFTPYDRSTFYSGGEKGYTDQKYSDEYRKEMGLASQ